MTPLNDDVLAVFEGLAPGGGYRFRPGPRAPDDPVNPRDPAYDGVRAPIHHRGEVVARAASDGATYCCGVTFEVWWHAVVRRTGAPPDLTVSEAHELLTTWFCPTMGHAGVVDGLVARGLGVEVTAHDAQPGDFVQYWRSTRLVAPSGHSAIFLGWTGPPAAVGSTIAYASSQPATDGVGRHHEIVGPSWTFAFARAGFAGS